MLTTNPVMITVDGRRTWRFPDGKTLPVVSGGADEGDPPAPAPTPAADPPPEVDEPLGPQGQKALDSFKERARTAEAETKRLKKIEDDYNALVASQLTDQEKAIADARKEGSDEATAAIQTATNKRLFRAELRAATAAKLNDTAIADLLVDNDAALKLLGLDEIPVTVEGDIDSEAISQKVDAYVAARPFLASSATQQPGSIDQGARASTAAAKSIDEQIADAEAAGNWKLSGRLKTQKLMSR